MKRIIVYVVLILILSGCGTLGLIESLSRDKEKPLVNSNEIIISEEKTKDSKYELLVHLYDDESCIDVSCRKLVKIKTETPMARELVHKDYANYVLIYDGSIKLINVNNKSQEVLDIPYSKSNNYVINLDDESENEKENVGKKIVSIVSSNDKEIKYYDYEKRELTESKSYESISNMNEFYLGQSSGGFYLVNYNGEEMFLLNNEINKDNIIQLLMNDNYVSVKYTNNRNKVAFVIYDLTGKEVMKKSSNITNVSLGEDEFYVFETKRLVVYNVNGSINKIIDTTGYDVKHVYKNYVFAVKDDNLIAYNIKNDDTNVLTSMSDKELVDISYKEDKKTGIYIIFKDSLENNFGLYYNLENKSIENFNMN